MQALIRAWAVRGTAVLISIIIQPQAFGVGNGAVIVAKPGQQPMTSAELKTARMGLQVKWATYYKVQVKELNSAVVEYRQPQPTESRLLRAPLDEEATFSLGGDLLISLQPKRWEQGTQRFSMVAELKREADSERALPAISQRVVLSGLLQKSADGTGAIFGTTGIDWVFIGEERFALYDQIGELVAEFSLGTLPEVNEILPSTAKKEVP